jgi:hypothetical protein
MLEVPKGLITEIAVKPRITNGKTSVVSIAIFTS